MITIWHNPACSTSRKVLDAIRVTGAEPVVVDYLKTGWTEQGLRALLDAAGLSPRAALRRKALAGLDPALPEDATDADILTAMLAHPVLVERPFVQTPLGTRLCRPVERLQEILPTQG